MSNRPFIPFHVPSVGEEEIREVEAALKSGWLTTGPRTTQFEKEFSAYIGSPHVIAVNSYTAALFVSLASLGIGDGDEVITTPLTFSSTVHTILQVGARPVLADVGADGNIEPSEVERLITPRTRAIIPMHFAGLPCDMRAIWQLARRYGLFVIEDAAHAAGARYQGQPIGAAADRSQDASDAVTFSFQATNNMTTGEGGMVATPRETLAVRMRMLSLHGIDQDTRRCMPARGNWHCDVGDGGFKCNLTDIQSAMGIHQLRKLDSFVEIRTRYAQIYRRALEGIEEVETPNARRGDRHSWQFYVLRLKLEALKIDRQGFIEELRQRGIAASRQFTPIPLHPFFADMHLARHTCKRALDLYHRIVSLPLYPAMTEGDAHYVARSVKDILRENRRAPARSHGVERLEQVHAAGKG